MAISIRNQRVEELARKLGRLENLSMTQVIIEALEEKLERSNSAGSGEGAMF